LNEMQKRFADYYLETGNATESAKRAGYSKKTARSQGQRLLTNVDIKNYIEERATKLDKKRIADVKEVMQFYSDVMRGEVKERFDVDAALGDRISAGKEIMKRFQVIEKTNAELELELQKAKLDLLKAQTLKITGDDESEIEDDGFLEALRGSAAEDWEDEED
jgi:Phage terminase, small subunit